MDNAEHKLFFCARWGVAREAVGRNRIGACTCGPAPRADLAVRVDRGRNLLVPPQVGAASRSAKRVRGRR